LSNGWNPAIQALAAGDYARLESILAGVESKPSLEPVMNSN